ncbi:unnamed protein product [Ixodes persulcatus]
MTSTMVRRSAIYAILGRLHGCFFIQNFHGKSLRNAKVTCKTRYTFYSFLWFAVYIFIETLFSIRFAYVIKNISDALSRSLMLVVLCVVAVKLTTNLAVMFTKPDQLLAFFRNSEAFETKTGFSARSYSLLHSAAHRWNAVRALAAFMGLVMYFSLAEWFIMVELRQSVPTQWSVPVGILGFFMGTGFILYDSLSYFFLRNCTNVLIEYIQVQVEGFQEAGKWKNFHFQPDAPLQIEAMRLRINKIRKLKETLNDIWAGTLIVACAGTVIIDCIVVDAVFHDGIKKELWLGAGYSMYSSLCFIDLAYTGQALVDEVRKIKSKILMVPAFGAPDTYLQQLRYLHESVDPEGMCFDVGGFFVLNKSLVLSMIGSVIIFGVILVQTSNSVTFKINAT